MGKRNPDLLQRGVSPSCRCGQDGEYHIRNVCGPCYGMHKDRFNPECYQRGLATWRRNYYENRDHHVGRAYAWNVRNKDRHYLNTVHHRYRLKPAEYKELFEAQAGRCAICLVGQEEMKSRLHVDHDHSSGEVRGLLCASCNRGLGAHEKAGTNTYKRYLEWTPMMRLKKLKTLSDEERALWNWS
jgi:hypothetical protein